jgi:hypothetical protein
MSDRIVEQVIAKYQQRSEVGIQKYGTTLQDNNKDNFLKHLQEELMDGSLYIEKLQEQLQTLINLVKTTPNDQELGEKIRSFVR